MAFTASDTPAIVARIQRDLDLVVERVRAADPGLRSLVLTGGFARGEGAVRRGAPQNDYDLVAARGLRPPRIPYDIVRQGLEEDLGLHIDLAPVAAARLRWAPRSIFWYETALRGQVLWGDPRSLDDVPVRRPLEIDRREAMRLLVNRAAGLVFATAQDDDAKRLQASKALLGTMDAWMLATGVFPPSQTERWSAFQSIMEADEVPTRLSRLRPWLAWAFTYKTRPDEARRRDGHKAWEVAARSVLEAVPEALQHAGLVSLEAYERQDSVVDHLHYLRSLVVRGGRPMRHPTSRVRVATLRTLRSCLEEGDAGPWMGQVAPDQPEPLAALATLRSATLQ